MPKPFSQCSFENLIVSDLFTFHVGEEKKAFTVHSAAIAATSESFRALVNGDMIEATTRSAELQDVLPADFVRFLEYAYRGDYTVPACTVDESIMAVSRVRIPPAGAPPPAPGWPDILPQEFVYDTPVLPGDAWAQAAPQPTSSAKKKLNRKPREVVAAPILFDFQLRDYLQGDAPNALLIEDCQIKLNTTAVEDFSPVFLAHARLYSFADMRLVYPLKKLALHKLQKTLLLFHLYPQRVGDILKLARYAYQRGPGRSKEGVIDELRLLVAEYMASNFSVIGKHPEFIALLEEGGELVTDFWRMVSDFWLES